MYGLKVKHQPWLNRSHQRLFYMSSLHRGLKFAILVDCFLCITHFFVAFSLAHSTHTYTHLHTNVYWRGLSEMWSILKLRGRSILIKLIQKFGNILMRFVVGWNGTEENGIHLVVPVANLFECVDTIACLAIVPGNLCAADSSDWE